MTKFDQAGVLSEQPSTLAPHDGALRGLFAALGRVHAIMRKLTGSWQARHGKVLTSLVDDSCNIEPARL